MGPKSGNKSQTVTKAMKEMIRVTSREKFVGDFLVWGGKISLRKGDLG